MGAKKPDEALQEPEYVASATECTGLMPALLQDEAQDESCAEMYSIHKGKGGRGEPRTAK